MSIKNRNLWMAAAVSLTTVAQSAQAQPTGPEQATPANAISTAGLEDIIVTARRQNENLQKVPVAASVLSGETLSRQGISSARDLQFTAPSLVITPDPLGGSGTPIIQLRGQTSPLGTDNTVVDYFGDVPVDARVIAAGIYDLDSVQIIRGPQGTLFGKNSTGGAVIFTPRKADTRSLNAFGEVNVGNYDLRQFTGAVNLPIVNDVLGLRVSGQITRQDGFVKNLLGPDGNDKRWEAGRAVLTFTPGGSFRNDLIFTYFNGHQHLNPQIANAIGGIANRFPAVVAGFNLQQQLGPRTIAMSEAIGPNNDLNESYLVSNVSSYQLGGVTFKNILGYSNSHISFRLNQPAMEFHFVDSSQKRRHDQISDEVQLAGNSFGNSLKWIVGGFYSKQEQAVIQRTFSFGNVANPRKSDSDDRYVTKAVFGQATYDFTSLGLAGVKLTFGLRHSWDSRTGSNVQNVPVPKTIKDNHYSWTVGLDYQINNDILLYVASRRSYKSGGFNLVTPETPAAILVYAPEVLTDIEIGAKARFEFGTVPLRANLALYRGKYENIQTQITGTCGSITTGASFIVNAGKGTPKGLELEMEAKPLKNLTISGFYNRTLGRYDRFTVPAVPGCTLGVGIADLTGQNFGNISKNTAGLNAVYTFPLGRNHEELQFSGNFYYRSHRVGNDLKGFNVDMPGYSLLNGRLDYNHVGGSALSVGAYVRNITNKLYPITRNWVITTAGFDELQYGDPRTYGIVARVEF